MKEELRDELKRFAECANTYEDALRKCGLAVHSPDEDVRGKAYGEVFRLRKILNGIMGEINTRMDLIEAVIEAEEGPPVFALSDDLVDAGSAVIKSIFPDADDDICGFAATGAFMAILSEREDGNVLFQDTDGGDVFRFPTRKERLS